MRNEQSIITSTAILLFSIIATCRVSAKEWECRNIDYSFGLNNSSINAILQDKTGMVWIGTWDGINRYDGNNIEHFTSIPNNYTSISNPVVRDIIEENDSVLWVVTEHGINRFSKRQKVARQFFLNSPANIGFIENAFRAAISKEGTIVANYNGGNLYIYNNEKRDFMLLQSAKGIGERITNLKFDANGNLVLCGGKFLHIARISNGRLDVVKKIQISENVVSTAFDNMARLWLQIGERLYYLHNGTIVESQMSVPAKMTCVTKTPKGYVVGTSNGCYAFWGGAVPAFHLPNVSITASMYGKQGILWIGTDGRGLFQYFEREQFVNSFKIGERSLPVRSISRQGDRLFVGTKGEGLLVYQIRKEREFFPLETHNVGPGRSNNAVFALCDSRDGKVWVGTDGTGLKYYKNGNIHSMQCSDKADGRKIYSVYSIVEANDSTLYLGCSGNGLLRVIWKGDMITSVRQYGKAKGNVGKSDIVYSVINDGEYIWAGTRGGGLMRLDTRTEELKFFRNDPKDRNSLWNNDIISLYKDSQDRLWIGMSQGLDMLVTKDGKHCFKHYDETGLPDLNIHNIQEDRGGNIWVSTSNGLARLTAKGESLNFSHSDGLQGNEFADGAGLAWNGGSVIFFGGTNGISVIYPQLIEDDSFMPQLQLCSVRADHAMVPLADSFTFDHDMVSCQFSFAIMDFISNDRCDLSYRLEKRSLLADDDDEWINIGNRRQILLNRLAPGNYVLHVRQSNSTHVWSDEHLAIPFHVNYPLWARWWAVCTYIATALATVRWVLLNKKRKYLLRHEREMEKQAMKYKEEIHHAKLRFFASVASRFSSHITHIYHAIEDIRLHADTQEFSDSMERISSNVSDMDRLIKRLSEIQSADHNDTAINPEQFNVAEAVKNSLDPFADQIEEQGVRLEIGIGDSLVAVTDKMLFLKAIHNILNYVLRSIDGKTTLTLGCKVVADRLAVTIGYHGQVPNEAEAEDIFNSYKALDIYENDMKRGEDVKYFRLTISNEMAKRLGGEVRMVNIGKDCATISFSVKQMPKRFATKGKDNAKEQSGIESIIESKRQSILVINDDGNMTELIKTSLEKDFNVTTISEGEYNASNDIPHSYDLVIYEPASPDDLSPITAMKTAENTRFTPIIAVCSASDKDTGTEMMRQGADSILEKPFRRDYLRAMVERELTTTDQMRDYSDSPMSYMRKIGASDMNKDTTDFLYKVVEKISKNYQDEDYNANSLAADLAMSRTQLYRKFKQFTEMSPTDIILEYRMCRAEKLLKTTDRSVSEIVSQCGFRNRAFFYREFTATHNCSPKEYKQQHNKLDH